MKIVPGPEWEGLLRRIIEQKGPVLLLGSTDSGKSTLARYLIQKLLEKGVNVSLVDADIGQSSLGLPGTICTKIFRESEHTDILKPEKMFFIGALNPAEKIPSIIEGVKFMVEYSRSEGIGVIIIDTTGLISGETGKALKLSKIRAVKPKHIVALQKHHELEHILSLIESELVLSLLPSENVKRRNREVRIHYRRKKFLHYLRNAVEMMLPLKKVEFFYNNRPVSKRILCIQPKSLVGLNRHQETVGLGVFQELLSDMIVIKTPVVSSRGVNRIVISDMFLDWTGNENNYDIG